MHSEAEMLKMRKTDDAADHLFSLQFQIARRADELARTRAEGTAYALHCWSLAETEIMGKSLPNQAADQLHASI